MILKYDVLSQSINQTKYAAVYNGLWKMDDQLYVGIQWMADK